MTKCCHSQSTFGTAVNSPKCTSLAAIILVAISVSPELLADEQSSNAVPQPVRAQIQPAESAEVIVAKTAPPTESQPGQSLLHTNLSPPDVTTKGSTGTKISRPKPAQLEDTDGKPPGFGGKHMLQTVIGSLAIVLGAFMLLVWFFKRNAPSGSRQLPKDVLEVLGSSPVGNRQQYQLLRLGRRLVLVNVHAQGVETITEVIDPREVARLTGMCQQNQSNSITESFRQVLEQFGEEPVSGFIDNENRSDQELAQGRQRSRRPSRSQFSEVV